ncbi:ATP-binding protein [Pseudomonadota bacterium]
MKYSSLPSLTRQTQLYIILALGSAVLLMGLIWITHSHISLEEQAERLYTSQADMIGAASKPAIMFRDNKLGVEMLETMKTNPDILSICLFSNDGKLIAGLPKDGNHPKTYPGHIDRQIVNFNDGMLKLTRVVYHKNEQVGLVYLESNLKELKLRQHSGIFTILLAMAGTIAIAIIFAFQLQRKLLSSENNLRMAITKAEAANHAKSEFLSTMSHELRTPLHGIIGLQSLIAQNAEQLSQEQRVNLKLAQQSSKSLQALVNDILDLSKIEAGNMELNNSEITLMHCIYSALIPFVALAREKKVVLSLNIENVPKTIICDESRLRQVLLNLVGNAVKFTDQGSVTLCVNERDGYLQFSIQDTGIGIPHEDLEYIFDPFVQASKSIEEKQTGTGLGTSIAKRFVELMGGEIKAESEPGSGSNFTFKIPYHAVGDEIINIATDSMMDLYNTIPTSEMDNHLAVQQSASRILLAEDDPISQRIAVKLLTQAGFSVDIAETGTIAWQKAKSETYDLILTDLRMPGIDGIELTKRIRRMERKNSLPAVIIIGLSAHALEEVATECIEAGMNQFMTKPVNPETILAVVSAGMNSDNNSA